MSCHSTGASPIRSSRHGAVAHGSHRRPLKALCTSLAVLSVLLPGSARAETRHPSQSWPAVLTLHNQSYALPFSNLLRGSPWHPGMMLGTEYRFTARPWGELAQTANLGSFWAPPIQSAVFLNSEFVYRYTLPVGPLVEFLVGPGYLHSFSTRPLFERSSKGYRRATDWGTAHFTLSVAIGAGFDFQRALGVPLALFVRYQPMFQLPGFLGSPVIPNGLLHLGARYGFGGAL